MSDTALEQLAPALRGAKELDLQCSVLEAPGFRKAVLATLKLEL